MPSMVCSVSDQSSRWSGSSPRAAGATLVIPRGLAVGHVFKLGCKYSEALGFEVMDGEQKRRA